MDAAQIVAAIVPAVLIIGPVAIMAWGWNRLVAQRPKPFPYGAVWTLMEKAGQEPLRETSHRTFPRPKDPAPQTPEKHSPRC
jgi:hypothetical protein